MKRLMLAMLLMAVGGVGLSVQAGDAVNPYAGAKVGDWVRFEGKTVAPSDEQSVETESVMYTQVMEKDEATVKLATVFLVTIDGQTQQRNLPVREINLSEPVLPLGPMLGRLPEEAKVEKAQKSETEKITAAGREWECAVWTAKVEMTEQQMSFEMTGWYAPDAPLSGMVGLDSHVRMVAGDQNIRNESTMRLAAFGDAENPDPDAPALELPEDEADGE